MRHAARRYDRLARVNEVVREVLADELERLADPQLGLLTITGVEVTPDLRQATVYYSALIPAAGEAEHQARELHLPPPATPAEALSVARPHLQAAIARQVRMKYTPTLAFREDPAIRTGERVDEILRQLQSEGE
jgi:ribosome-binding factor A